MATVIPTSDGADGVWLGVWLGVWDGECDEVGGEVVPGEPDALGVEPNPFERISAPPTMNATSTAHRSGEFAMIAPLEGRAGAAFSCSRASGSRLSDI
jgi:hypothetical protein